jgi:hypothetical protein
MQNSPLKKKQQKEIRGMVTACYEAGKASNLFQLESRKETDV